MDYLVRGIALLDPKGVIGEAELQLIVQATLFMLIVAIPVFFLLFFFARHYRAGNKKAKYTPEWEHAKIDELIWWAIPLEIVLILGALAWSSTHELDPYKPLQSDNPPIVVQVVSLNWKWLFIYPEQNIATVNYLAIPEQTPVQFQLTSDAPMNAFWIPQLGGMEMTMPGMVTQLHLMANETGEYQGLSSNYSGEGFAGMRFKVDSMTQSDFAQWVAQVKSSSQSLTLERYHALAEPSTDELPAFYTLGDSNLYTEIVSKFMMPMDTMSEPTH